MLINLTYVDKPFLAWQTSHILTNPVYLDNLTHLKIDKSFIFWQTPYILTYNSKIDKPFIIWQTFLIFILWKPFHI